jgi:uncharacterized protein (DUF2141 family)
MRSIGLLMLFLSIAIVLAVSCEKAEEILGITISGNISTNGQPVEGAFVLLVDKAEMTNGFPIGNGSITMDNGNYTIVKVEDGVYYIAAVKDEDGNNSYDLGTDPIGWYGHPDSLTGLTIPDSVIVSGSDLTEIDIDTLYTQ